MGIEEIRYEYTDKKADRTIVEIDENLVRRELDKTERTKLVNRKARVLQSIAADAGRKLGQGSARKGATGNQHTGKLDKSRIETCPKEPTPAEAIADEAGRSRSAVYKELAKSRMAEASFDEPVRSEVMASKLFTGPKMKAYFALATEKDNPGLAKDKATDKGKAAALAEYEADKLLASKPKVEKAEKEPKQPKPPKVPKPKPEPVSIPAAPIIETLTIDDEWTAWMDRGRAFMARMTPERKSDAVADLLTTTW
jgi:hypothetical protein